MFTEATEPLTGHIRSKQTLFIADLRFELNSIQTSNQTLLSFYLFTFLYTVLKNHSVCYSLTKCCCHNSLNHHFPPQKKIPSGHFCFLLQQKWLKNLSRHHYFFKRILKGCSLCSSQKVETLNHSNNSWETLFS